MSGPAVVSLDNRKAGVGLRADENSGDAKLLRRPSGYMILRAGADNQSVDAATDKLIDDRLAPPLIAAGQAQ